eukprot:5690595-Prymnesium_polylepis.1
MDKLRLQLMKVRVCGIESVSRAIIVQKSEGEKTAAEKASGKGPCTHRGCLDREQPFLGGVWPPHARAECPKRGAAHSGRTAGPHARTHARGVRLPDCPTARLVDWLIG